MNILIAPDSYKESLTAPEVCQAIFEGFEQVFPNATYQLLPLADGGEGTATILSYNLQGIWKSVTVNDPLMRPIQAKYFITYDDVAIIEVAEACGLHLLQPLERNPMHTTSFGVGELILDAINQGAKEILIGLGGSSTNDAGAGMLQALGAKLLDKNDIDLKLGGGHLVELHRVEFQKVVDILSSVTITVACDVTNPLCGPNGASFIFGPQKGASLAQLKVLDDALAHFATISQSSIGNDQTENTDNHHSQEDNIDYHNTYSIKSNTSNNSHNNNKNTLNTPNNQQIDSKVIPTLEDLSKYPGAGAAGGLGYALLLFCNASLKSGFDTIAKMVDLESHIAEADLVITGEGKLDAQTNMGKVASGVAERANQLNKPVIAICGSVDRVNHVANLNNFQQQFEGLIFDIVMPSIQKFDTLEQILANAYSNVTYTAFNLALTMKLGQQMYVK